MRDKTSQITSALGKQEEIVSVEERILRLHLERQNLRQKHEALLLKRYMS